MVAIVLMALCSCAKLLKFDVNGTEFFFADYSCAVSVFVRVECNAARSEISGDEFFAGAESFFAAVSQFELDASGRDDDECRVSCYMPV